MVPMKMMKLQTCLLLLLQLHVCRSYSWNAKSQLDRRKLLSRILTTTSSVVMVPSAAPSLAMDFCSPSLLLLSVESEFSSSSSSNSLEVGLLETRVTENVLSPPPYGMEAFDVTYPAWLAGTWRVASTTTDVLAPCGVALFGGNATYIKARGDIGMTLEYTSRFVPVGTTASSGGAVCDETASASSSSSSSSSSCTTTTAPAYCIADRDYNVQSLAKAALGANSMVNVKLATPNQFSCVVAPKGSPSLLSVDLLTLNRRQEVVSDTRFDCSEVVREIVSALDADGNSVSRVSSNARQPLLKEIETTSLYTYNAAKNQVTCRQRSAAFLLPSQNDPVALKLWQAARGRPIDVRYYDVVYTK